MMTGDRGAGAIPAALVYRLYPDGREEPLRGAQVEGITAASFRDIVAAGDNRAVLTGGSAAGFRGAMGGYDPDPAISSFIVPSLLLEEATVRKQEGRTQTPPVMSPPWGRN
jgi:hypothetical protein